MLQGLLQTALAPLIEILLGVVLVLLGLAARRLADWLGLAADDRARRYLDEVLHRSLSYARASSAVQALGEKLPPAAIEAAAEYAQQRVPDALGRFGISAEALRQMLVARDGGR